VNHREVQRGAAALIVIAEAEAERGRRRQHQSDLARSIQPLLRRYAPIHF
jgi:hypothetical protein